MYLRFRLLSAQSLVWCGLVWCSLAVSLSSAADPAFFGVLSLLEDDAVIQQLELTDDQQQALANLIVKRESAALSMATKLKDLPSEEQASQRAEFVAESEKAGLALLNESQRESLEKIQIQREGGTALLRDELADELELSDAQRKQLRDLVKRRADELEKTVESKHAVVRKIYENRMIKLLSAEQKEAFESLTAVADAGNQDQRLPGPPDDRRGPGGRGDRRFGDRSTGDRGPGGRGPGGRGPGGRGPGGPGAGDIADAEQGQQDQPMLQGLSADENGNLTFNFGYAPWSAVLEWFATEADLSLVMDAPPPGTFNYVDSRAYPPSEAIDVLNSVLLTKGYTLVRRERMLLLINLEDGIPPNLVTTVSADELDDRGEFELVGTLFQLGKVSPEDAETELTKLLGPQGSMQVLGKAKQAFVIETAGRLRTIRDVLRAMGDPNAAANSDVATIELEHIMPEEAFTVIRQMLGIPDELLAMPDGSLRMGTDIAGQRLMLTGQPERIDQVRKLLALVDVALPQAEYDEGGILASPQLEVYPIVGADSQSAYDVVNTMLADAQVKLAIDPKTGNLIALATPSQHATIRATLSQMSQGGQVIEVIPLDYVDPQRAVLAINQLFGAAGEEGAEGAPIVSADITNSLLLVRGRRAQIDQIRELMNQMGEGEGFAQGGGVGSSENVRVLTLNKDEADRVLQQIEAVWPSMRKNPIRTVVPSAVSSSINQRDTRRDGQSQDEASEGATETESPSGAPSSDATRQPDASGEARSPSERDSGPIRTDIGVMKRPVYLAQVEVPSGSASAASSAADADANPSRRRAATSIPGDPIVVSHGASGLIIASRDLEALDDFEDLVLSIVGEEATTSSREFAVFYLRHATAAAASELLNTVLSGGSGGDSGGGGGGGGMGGGLLDGLMGGMGGGLMDSLLGPEAGGGGLTASGSYSIVPEARLNLLMVQANPADMQLIENLLEIIDQRKSPETVEVIPSPRLIQIYNTSAELVANVIRETFSQNLVSGGGGGGGGGGRGGGPSPEDFLRALRGRGGQGGGGGGAQEVKKEMTLSVDTRNNQLVVAAPDDLFEQVKALAEMLDVSNPETVETTRVVTLDKANPQMVQRALLSIIGQSSTANQPSSNNAAAGNNNGGGNDNNRGRGGDNNGDAARRNAEIMRAIQARQGGDRGGRGGRGGGDAGRGGRGGRGGFGGGGFGGGRGGRGGR